MGEVAAAGAAGYNAFMLEDPGLRNESITNCLKKEFGLKVDIITFLALGADLDTAVYRVRSGAGEDYFLKLRRGKPNRAAVTVPNYLYRQGIKQVIPTIETKTGQIWATLDPYKVILYPYIEGHKGFATKLPEQKWVEFGVTLKRFHQITLPPEVTKGVVQETFSPKWREIVLMQLDGMEKKSFSDPVAADMAAFLRNRRDETIKIVKRADQLARTLQDQPLERILCHGDIHGWNLHFDASGNLYLVDWDTLIFAPKERDLMFIGAGLGDSGYTPHEEQRLFYQGYGQTEIDRRGLAYFRYERIIEDIAIYCRGIFMSSEGGLDRKQWLANLESNYLPGGTIDVARHSDSYPDQAAG